ncbi:multiheme c-type cytochrome [Tropicimonas sp. S265A]|uniref:multiheme c-type cytochrome n=1 Tax=Tropicimonas sp. S265A TaxID=3415134 RepID=UPI003C7ED842
MRVLLFVFLTKMAALSAIPSVAQEAEYVGSGACIDCHTDAAQDWQGSHHAGAWTEATAENITADFDGTSFALRGLEARFRIEPDGAHHVEVTEPDGTTRDYPVHSVIGVEPLQQYVLETEPGRLQSFDVVWDTEEGGWFHIYPSSDLSPRDGLHWSGPYKNWNARCAACHATGFEKNYILRSRSYASTQVEIGVGCEACHGPGSTHVNWAQSTPQPAPPQNYGFAMDFSDTEATIQQCATCHSRREAHLDGNPMPGSAFHDDYNLALLREGLYHPDGQILEEVFVYGSFLQSKMYSKGVGCLDCHNPHSAQRIAEGNAVCTQCHSLAGNPDYPSLELADYDAPSHHFHPDGSAGAQCKNCHMVEQVYMGNDRRADHSFRIPRPDLAAQTGTPDACTECHTDRTPDWAAAQLIEWYPDSDARGPHYGTTLALGREDAVAASEELIALALDTQVPGIVRATALSLVERAGSFTAAEDLVPLLSDPDPLVRAAAAGAQRAAPVEVRVDRLLPLMEDTYKNVRIEAARALLDADPSAFSPIAQEVYQNALDDWRGAISNRLDFPETHLQLAGIAMTNRDFRSAVSAFREAVAQDPQRVDAWVMMIRIGAALGAQDRTLLDLLNEALEANPDDPALLGILAQLRGLPTQDGLLPPQ